MPQVHACFRTALRHAFRTNLQSCSSALALPEFLVPAVSRESCKRTFSSTRRRRHEASTELPLSESRVRETQPYSPLPPRDPRIEFAIPLPSKSARKHIQQWLALLDPYLPPDLRQTAAEANTPLALPATALDFARILVEAQHESLDILSHLGLEQGRWDVVLWLIKNLVDAGPALSEKLERLDPFENVTLPEDRRSASLKILTEAPILAHRLRPPDKSGRTLRALVEPPETIQYALALKKRALGQVWRSLGSMILVAAQNEEVSRSTIMPHVLEIIAYLHHSEMVPQSIYRHKPASDVLALQQPPTLHLFSSRILSSLSDATWRAHETSSKIGQGRNKVSYFLGHEIPGSRYRSMVPELSSEVWLELVLWSCLHGGWVLDGTKVLEDLLKFKDQQRWALLCWRDILGTLHDSANSSQPTDWNALAKSFQYHADSRAGDRDLVRRTISSEIVTAFVDGLINDMRLGVGERGTSPEKIVRHIKNLKQLLDRDNLSLGTMSWDSVIVRLLESGGIVPEKAPELMLELLELASGFGAEPGSANASQQAHAEPDVNYCFDASAVPIGLLHRNIRSFIKQGDISGTMETLKKLQGYTDANKKKSLAAFFQRLKETTDQQRQPFTNRLAPIEYPGFSPQIPPSLLASILDLVSSSRLYDIGTWLLFSKDVDGPLITAKMWSSREVAPALIRFGTAARNHELIRRVVEMVTVPNAAQKKHRLPAEVLSAFLNSQIQHRRWTSVQGILRYVNESPGYRPQTETLAVFAAEVLRSSDSTDGLRQRRQQEVRQAFSSFLQSWHHFLYTSKPLSQDLNIILAIMSTVATDLSHFCTPFFATTGRQYARLGAENFNVLLDGVLDGYGSGAGKRLIDTWCHSDPRSFREFVAPGGLVSLERFRPNAGEDYERKASDLGFSDTARRHVVFEGRLNVDIQTVRAVLRKVTEEGSRGASAVSPVEERMEMREALRWAAELFGRMGLDWEDISRNVEGFGDAGGVEMSGVEREVVGGESNYGV